MLRSRTRDYNGKTMILVIVFLKRLCGRTSFAFLLSSFFLPTALLAEVLAVNVGNYKGEGEAVQVECQLIGAGRLRYPPKARKFRYTGQVVVGFSVTEDGSVAGAHIADADPPGIFERSALSHIRTWKYNPPQYNGENVQVDDIYVRLVFKPDR